jgi:hypothetical protein
VIFLLLVGMASFSGADHHGGDGGVEAALALFLREALEARRSAPCLAG